jgi:hypothetical protein
MIKDFYIILKPGEEIRPPIYSISSHRFYLIACRLTPKFPIFLVKLIVRQKKLDSDFMKQTKSMLINTDAQQTLTQNICPSHRCYHTCIARQPSFLLRWNSTLCYYQQLCPSMQKCIGRYMEVLHPHCTASLEH